MLGLRSITSVTDLKNMLSEDGALIDRRNIPSEEGDRIERKNMPSPAGVLKDLQHNKSKPVVH